MNLLACDSLLQNELLAYLFKETVVRFWQALLSVLY